MQVETSADRCDACQHAFHKRLRPADHGAHQQLERTQQTFSQMKKFCSSQVSVVTFSGGVGKWITDCCLVR